LVVAPRMVIASAIVGTTIAIAQDIERTPRVHTIF